MKVIRLATQVITEEQNEWLIKQSKFTKESRATVIRKLIDKAIEADKRG